MNIYANSGDKIIYKGVKGSRMGRDYANQYLDKNETYLVEYTDESYKLVSLREFPELLFDCDLFEDYEEDIPVEEKDRDKEND